MSQLQEHSTEIITDALTLVLDQNQHAMANEIYKIARPILQENSALHARVKNILTNSKRQHAINGMSCHNSYDASKPGQYPSLAPSPPSLT